MKLSDNLSIEVLLRNIGSLNLSLPVLYIHSICNKFHFIYCLNVLNVICGILCNVNAIYLWLISTQAKHCGYITRTFLVQPFQSRVHHKNSIFFFPKCRVGAEHIIYYVHRARVDASSNPYIQVREYAEIYIHIDRVRICDAATLLIQKVPIRILIVYLRLCSMCKGWAKYRNFAHKYMPSGSSLRWRILWERRRARGY